MKRQIFFGVALIALLSVFGFGCPKKPSAVEPTVRQKTDGKAQLSQADALFDAGYPGTEAGNRAQFRIAQCLVKQEKNEEALEQFKRYVEHNRNDSDLTVAEEYILSITENRLTEKTREYDEAMNGFEDQNLRMTIMNQNLRKSVDSEVIYLELDFTNDRLFVKMGTQTLYQYPIISGKGKTRLKGTGEIKNFSSPRGIRKILFIEKDPLWYRPDWYWIEKGLPLPPNLSMKDRAVPNHLGPYKLALGDGIYLHGTAAGKIKPGKFSHGCIRLNNADLVQLVHLVDVGTMVYLY